MSDGYVTGPKRAIIPGNGVSSWWVISLYVVIGIFRFVYAIAVNSIATTIQFLSCRVRVVRIWKDVKAFDYDAASQMEAHVVNDNTKRCFSANCEGVHGVVTINTNCLRGNASGSSPTWIASLQLVLHRRGQINPAPTSFASNLSVIAVLCDDRIATARVAQSHPP